MTVELNGQFVGLVELKAAYGTDYDIANHTGMCKGTCDTPLETKDVIRRINYLVQNGHTMPFEFADVIFDIVCPLFVFSQLRTYRTGSYLCRGGRYNDPVLPFFYGNENKKGVFERYEAIKEESGREAARCILPQGEFVQFLMKMDLNNFFKMTKQRLSDGAQAETRCIVQKMYDIVQTQFPITAMAYELYAPKTYAEMQKCEDVKS